MSSRVHFLKLFVCILLCAPVLQAQTPQRDRQSTNTTAHEVTIIIQQQHVRFTAPQPNQELGLQIFNQSGEMIYDSGAAAAPELTWDLLNASGEAVASGLYDWRLTIKEQNVETPGVRRGHLIVDRSQDREAGVDRLWITSQSPDGIGAEVASGELTVARTNENTIAGTRTGGPGASTSGSGSDISGGPGANGPAHKSKKGKGVGPAALDPGSTGTASQIAKWVNADLLGDSAITETDGNVGIGTTNPTAKLMVQTAPRNYGLIHRNSDGVEVGTWAGAGLFHPEGGWFGTRSVHPLHFFTANGSASMTITTVGNVGIGTAYPRSTLEVLGGDQTAIRGISSRGAGVYGFATDDNSTAVVGTNGNGIGVYGRSGYGNGIGVYGEGGSSGGYFTNTTNGGLALQVVGDIQVQGNNGDHPPSLSITGVQPFLKLTDFATTLGGTYTIQSHDGGLYFEHNASGRRMVIDSNGLDVAGRTRTPVLQITGGADFSENFDVNVAATTTSEAVTPRVEAGMVVSIDPANPGKLALSAGAYDRRVAGIISGAGGVKPGVMMSQAGTLADGQHPVALTGRVYCWADASQGAIEPGDLLTTAPTPGHAMKVTDHARAQGAIIGKAMTGLKSGQGLVLVLVTLQ